LNKENPIIQLHNHTNKQIREHNPISKMPVVPKSYLPAFSAFMICGITYTTVVALQEGAAIDGARSRWMQQQTRAREALSKGRVATMVQELEVAGDERK